MNVGRDQVNPNQGIENPELQANLAVAGLNQELQDQIMAQINRRVKDGIRALAVAGPQPAAPADPCTRAVILAT